MPVSPARSVAFEILLRVEREDSYAAELLHSTRLAKLSPRDHGLATELVMGVLRWQSLLDQRLADASSQKLERLDAEVLAALRLGVYQLQFLSRVPARAAIFESVELVKAARKRSAASFVNAVLRKLASAGAEDIFAEIGKSPDAITLARNAAHPLWLVARWTEHYGLETTRQICIHDQTVPATAIHIHDDRSSDDLSDTELAEAGIKLAPGRLLSPARRVVSGDITGTRAYQESRVSIQDEASQLVALLAGRSQKIAETILDCCAAPGSKTALLARRNPPAKVLRRSCILTARVCYRTSAACRMSMWSLRTRVSCLSRLPSIAFSPTFLVPELALWPAIPRSSGGSKPKTCAIFNRDRWPSSSRHLPSLRLADGFSIPRVRWRPRKTKRWWKLPWMARRNSRSPISRQTSSNCASLAKCAGWISHRFSPDPT